MVILVWSHRLPSFAFNIATWPGEDANVWAPPLNLTNDVAVSGRDLYAKTLGADGTVVYWNGATPWTSELINIFGIAAAVVTIWPFRETARWSNWAAARSVGARHSLVAKADGTCVSWAWVTVVAYAGRT